MGLKNGPAVAKRGSGFRIGIVFGSVSLVRSVSFFSSQLLTSVLRVAS